jgi:hypothetical protein
MSVLVAGPGLSRNFQAREASKPVVSIGNGGVCEAP